MVALPSLPETASRTAPVAVFTTEILASLTTAPAWSTTRTTIVAVLGDWARSGAAMTAKSAMSSNGRRNRPKRRPWAAETGVFIEFSFDRVARTGRRGLAELDVPAPADQKEIDGSGKWVGRVRVAVVSGPPRARNRGSRGAEQPSRRFADFGLRFDVQGAVERGLPPQCAAQGEVPSLAVAVDPLDDARIARPRRLSALVVVDLGI